MSENSFRIGLIQGRDHGSAAANLERTVEAVGTAAGRGAGVVCTQELFTSSYFCQVEDSSRFELAEPIPGPTTRALSAAARKHQVAVIGSLFERRAAGVYHNTAVVIDADGTLLGLYRKMHIPDDPLYYEKFYFTPGDRGFQVFDTRHGRIGVLVCWDQWYPEAARLTALRGAEILVYPTAIGWHPKEKDEWGAAQHDAWLTAQRAHAIANGVYVAAVNRVGHETEPGNGDGKDGGIEFWGGSFVADPIGRVIAQASRDDEEVLVTEVRRDLIEEVRRNWPFLRDRRIDAYDGLQRRLID